MDDIIQGLIGIIPQLLMMGVSAVAGSCWGKLKASRENKAKQAEQEKQERDQYRAMFRWVFDFQLRDFYERYVVRGGQITTAEKHEIETIYGYYHDTLGGNGEGTRKYNALMSLKTE